jgi:hypothetical protein
MDAELGAKQNAKYDTALEAAAIKWIEGVLGCNFNGTPFGPGLKDGKILCALVNKIQPGSVAKIEQSAMPFKQMENVSNFLKACRKLGVKDHDCFETVDLFEEKDLGKSGAKRLTRPPTR